MKSEQSELPAVIPKHQMAVAPIGQAPDVAVMLHAVIEKGVTAENVNAVKEIVGLYERMQDRDAVKQFAVAFAELQEHMPTIKAEKVVPDKNGGVKYTYAPMEDIMKQLQPFLTKYGFSVSFSQRLGDKTVTSICTVTHIGGHSRPTEFTTRTGSGPYGGTERDADVGATTVAQREALCDAFNIVRRRDGNAALQGAPITKEQADELAHRIAMTNSNKDAFLKLAGAKSYAEIMSSKYPMLDEMLRKKEQAGK